MPPCPDRRRLADLVLGNATTSEASALAAHVESCPTCGEEVANLAREVADGVRGPRGRTRGESGGRSNLSLWVAMGAVVVLVLVVVAREDREPAVLSPAAAAPPGSIGVRAFARTAGEIRELREVARVRGGDTLRLAIEVGVRGFLYVVRVGPRSDVRNVHPPEGRGSVAFGPEQRGFLPGKLVVRASPEAERIFVLFSSAPLSHEVVRAAVERDLARAGGLTALRRLSVQAAQWTLLLEKELARR